MKLFNSSLFYHPAFKIVGLAILVMVSSILGVAIGNRFTPSPQKEWPIPLLADSAAKGKTVSLATGLISPEIEGLYVLDHASGLLQCWILNPRNGAVGGVYQANVMADFGADKIGQGDFVMVAGGFAFTGGHTGNMTPSSSIVYVADESSGVVVGYHFAFNRNELNRGIMQQGMLRRVCGGPSRTANLERDQ